MGGSNHVFLNRPTAMKHQLRRIIVIIPVVIFCFVVTATLSKRKRLRNEMEKIRIFPDLELTDIYGDSFQSSALSSAPLLVTFFHPECDYCCYEISSLASGLFDGRNLTILLISYADIAEINVFVQSLEKENISAFRFIHDPDLSLANLFRADLIPSNYFYNKRLELVKIHKGSLTPEAINKYLFTDD